MEVDRFVPTHQITDPITQTQYILHRGQLQITSKDKPFESFPVSPTITEPKKKSNRFYLKFVKKNSSLVSLSPQGTLISCKSDRIQEVDLNITLDRGQIWWELFVPHTTLFLTVGVKDTKHTQSHTFDFCLKNSAKLQFKLNVDGLYFKTWHNGLST